MNTRLRPFWCLVRKDFRLFLSDRRAVVLSLIAPVALASFMAALMRGAGGSGQTAKIPIRVADEDGSTLSRAIVEAIAGDEALEARTVTPDEARQAVKKGRVSVALILPKGFGADAPRAMFGPGEKPVLTVVADPTHAAEAGMVRGLLTRHVMESVSREAFSGRAGLESTREALTQIDGASGMDAGDRQALRGMLESILKWQGRVEEARVEDRPIEARGLSAPFEVREESVVDGGEQAEGELRATHAFVGMAVQFVMFSAIELGVGLLTERQRGLWRRLRAAPVTRFEILASRAVSGALIALSTVAVVFAFGWVVFGIRIRGSLPGFAIVAAAYALSASTFGLLIAALGKTPQAARGVSVLAVLLMVMLGGAWFPSFLFPAWLQKVTPAIPTRWAVDGLETMAWRGGLADALVPTVALLGFAALFSALTAWRFRWETE